MFMVIINIDKYLGGVASERRDRIRERRDAASGAGSDGGNDSKM